MKSKEQKFCNSSCSASMNNVGVVRNGSKLTHVGCLHCKQVLRTKNAKKYCSRQCQIDFNYTNKVNLWLSNRITGLTCGVVSPFVKRWLRELHGDACQICGWSEVNVVTNKVPVVADHIDGNYRNNRPENLQLICPNCDSLQSTYKGLNRGNGRPNRLARYHLDKNKPL